MLQATFKIGDFMIRVGFLQGVQTVFKGFSRPCSGSNEWNRLLTTVLRGFVGSWVWGFEGSYASESKAYNRDYSVKILRERGFIPVGGLNI